MLSGIQRVAKENIFSGLYNLKVCSVIDAFIANILALMKKKLNKYQKYYRLDLDDKVKRMDDGYYFDGLAIYNHY